MKFVFSLKNEKAKWSRKCIYCLWKIQGFQYGWTGLLVLKTIDFYIRKKNLKGVTV